MDGRQFIKTTAGDIGTFRGGSGFPIRHQGMKRGQYPFFKVSDMNNVGNELYMTRARNYISEAQRKQMGAARMPKGAIVFAKVGAAIFLERKRILAQDSCIDNNMCSFMVDRSIADVDYVHYLLMNFRLSSLVATTALPSLNGSQLRSIPLLLPEQLQEQQAIAATLADVDGLITSLERLVTKKQAIKQGMMQRLLTGRTRLSGFAGPWQESRLEEIASIDPETLSAGTNPKEEIDYISLEDVERGEITDYSRLQFGVAPSRARRVVREMDVLFGTVRPNLQSHALYKGGLRRPIASTGFAVIRAHRGAGDPQFVFHLLMSYLATVQIDRIIAGSNYPAVSSQDVRRLSFSIPNLDEQNAIGAALTACDDELGDLKKRLDKARAVRQGMMQELLTGRTRLAVLEPSA